jgi:hypothetical protein
MSLTDRVKSRAVIVTSTRSSLIALLTIAGVAVLMVGAALAAPSYFSTPAAHAQSNQVHVYASEFAFVLDRTIIPAGEVEFELVNLSDEYRHELWIYPVDERDSHAFHEMLELKRTGQRASETDFIQGIVARSGELEAGHSVVFTATLPPGVYEVACLAREGDGDVRMVHYDEGMFAALIVRAP